METPVPGGFLVHVEPQRAAACGCQRPGRWGSCGRPKAVAVHDAHLAHPSTPGLRPALGIAPSHGARKGSGTVEGLEATLGSPGAARCVIWCEQLD